MTTQKAPTTRRAPIILASGHRLFFLAAALWAATLPPATTSGSGART